MRSSFYITGIFLLFLLSPSGAQTPPLTAAPTAPASPGTDPAPANPPSPAIVAKAVYIPLPEPPTLYTVTFESKISDVRKKLIVTASPNHLRVELPEARLTVIYNPAYQSYIGLERSNATYWQFSWPDVQAAVNRSQRAQGRMHELTSDGLLNYDSTGNNSTAVDSVDSPLYTWIPTAQKKTIGGYPCVLWIGKTTQDDTMMAWCTPGLHTRILDTLKRLREINEPMALVPIRELVPPNVFPAYDTLVKGGITPVLLLWGAERNRNQFGFTKAEIQNNKASLFQVPNTYTQTTLVTLDGIIPNNQNSLNKP